MFFLTAFYDEGGTDTESPTGGVSGFAMPSDHWVLFAKEWGDVLRKPPAIEYFHAVEANNFIDQFEGWKKPQRDEKVIALLDVICKWRPIALPQAVDKAALVKMVQRYPASGIPDDPYVFCLSNQFIECADLVTFFPLGTTLSIVMENNEQMRRAATEGYAHALTQVSRFKRSLADNISFGCKKKLKPLQAADFFTYEIDKNMANRLRDKNCQLRPPLKRIMASCRKRGVLWDEGLLEYAFKHMSSMTNKDRVKFLKEAEEKDGAWKRGV